MDPDRRQSDPHFPREPADAQTLPDADRVRAYERYQTILPHIYAVGDVIGYPALAHMYRHPAVKALAEDRRRG